MNIEKTIEWVKTDECCGYSLMIDQTIIPYEKTNISLKPVNRLMNRKFTLLR